MGRFTTWPTRSKGSAMVSRCPAMIQATTSLLNPNLSWKNRGGIWLWLALRPMLKMKMATVMCTSLGSRSAATNSRHAERLGGMRLASASEKRSANTATQAANMPAQSQNTLSSAGAVPDPPATSQ